MWHENLNLYWLAFTGLAIWFLFIHSPPILVQNGAFGDLPFAAHLAGAYLINLACVFNAVFTPSSVSDGRARPFHVAVGRIGMIAGGVCFLFGAVCAWWPTRDDLPPKPFAIGITIGGCIQITYQFLGYRAIRRYQALKEKVLEIEANSSSAVDDGGETTSLQQLRDDRDQALVDHIMNMLALFAVGCSTPGLLRLLLAYTQVPPLVSLAAGISICVISVRPYANTYIHRMKSVPPEEAPLLS